MTPGPGLCFQGQFTANCHVPDTPRTFPPLSRHPSRTGASTDISQMKKQAQTCEAVCPGVTQLADGGQELDSALSGPTCRISYLPLAAASTAGSSSSPATCRWKHYNRGQSATAQNIAVGCWTSVPPQMHGCMRSMCLKLWVKSQFCSLLAA